MARLDRRIAIGPLLYLYRRVRLEHKDATQYGVVHKWPGNHKFVFGSHLADVSHVVCLKLFTRLVAQLRSVGRAIQQYEEVLGGLGIWLVLGWEGVGLSSSNLGHQDVADVVPVRNQFEGSLCI